MVRNWSRMYAVLGALLAFGLVTRAAAQEPVGEPLASVAADPHGEVSANANANANESATPSSPEAALQARADAIMALIDGTLDPSADARALFVVDSETLGAALIEALESPSEKPDPSIAPPPTAAPDPLAVARDALRKAMVAFLALDPEQRGALLQAHETKTAAIRQERRWDDEAERLDTQANGLQTLVAGTIEPGTDVDALVLVDALSLLPTKPPPEGSEGS